MTNWICTECKKHSSPITEHEGKSYCKSCSFKLFPEKYPDGYVCVECNEAETCRYMKDEAMRERKLCFSCNHWLHDRPPTKPDHLIHAGDVYRDCGNSPGASSSLLGFGGRRFVLKWNDGREIHSNNVWCGGEIPERFRHLYPDNGTIYEEGHKAPWYTPRMR